MTPLKTANNACMNECFFEYMAKYTDNFTRLPEYVLGVKFQ